MKIIQIGTCVGNDDLTELLNNNTPELLVLVEPMEIHNHKINQCYGGTSNVYIENIAITEEDTEEEIPFFYHKDDGPNYEVSTTNVNHILKHGYNIQGIKSIKVKCMSLNSLFNKYNLNNIDVLFIDAEGLDDSIIKSINFEKYIIKKIFFENLHIKDNNIYEFLNSKGYKITYNIGHRGWTNMAEILT